MSPFRRMGAKHNPRGQASSTQPSACDKNGLNRWGSMREGKWHFPPHSKAPLFPSGLAVSKGNVLCAHVGALSRAHVGDLS